MRLRYILLWGKQNSKSNKVTFLFFFLFLPNLVGNDRLVIVMFDNWFRIPANFERILRNILWGGSRKKPHSAEFQSGENGLNRKREREMMLQWTEKGPFCERREEWNVRMVGIKMNNAKNPPHTTSYTRTTVQRNLSPLYARTCWVFSL